MKKFLLFIPLLFLTGCIGIGVVHKKTYINSSNVGKNLQEIKMSYSNLELVESNNEFSSYKVKNNNLNLIGIVPMVGIGIPLIIPFGQLEDRFFFKNNICINYVVENSTWSGFMCGILNENGKTGCSTLGN